MDTPHEEALFGRWLRKRRKALALTQKLLARQVGCSAATIRKLEADERHPSRHVAGQLAAVLGVPEPEREAFIRFARGGWADQPPAVGWSDLERPWIVGAGGMRGELPIEGATQLGAFGPQASATLQPSRDVVPPARTGWPMPVLAMTVAPEQGFQAATGWRSVGC